MSKLGSDKDIFMVALNPNNYLRDEIAECFIDIPIEFDKGDFKLFDIGGNEIEKQILNVEHHQPVLEQLIDRPMYFDMMRYRCMLDLRDVPGFGYKTYSVLPCQKSKVKSQKFIASTTKLPILQNDFLRVKINQNGTFDLFDKQNQQAFQRAWLFL